MKLSGHARQQARRRQIPEEVVLAVSDSPEQTIEIGGGRQVRQSRIAFPKREEPYLVRVVVDRLEGEELIVTAYRTSRIKKYWEPE